MAAFALVLVFAGCVAGWALTRQQPERPLAAQNEMVRTEQKVLETTQSRDSLPREDVPGRDVPDLPRYPNSVRVEYEREEQGSLLFTRVRYLSHAKLDVIRGFYRGVFRSKNWTVANVEFSGGEWTFLVVDGEREAAVEIGSYGPGVTEVYIETSEPRPTKEATPEQRPRQETSPATPETPAPAPPAESTPTPQPKPVPAPDDEYYEGEDQDDLDDEGGDD